MRAVLPRYLPAFLAVIVSGALAAAEFVDTPECRRSLALADELVQGVRQRQSSVPDDLDGLCRLLRRNLRDMTRAREPMARCLTGHDLGENVVQIDAMIGDIRNVLEGHCAGR